MLVFLRNPWSSMARHLLAGLAVATAAAAQDLGEPHLTPVSRTPDEAALVATLTAITPKPSAAEAMPGGAATVPVRRDDEAFSAPSGNLPPERLADFRAGKALFAKLWIAAPSALVNSDGLGPLYNARSCQACHVRDGRGHPPTEADGGVATMVLRLSIPALAETGALADYLTTEPDPVYGSQLQDFGTDGHPAEYRLKVTWDSYAVPLSGGETATLRRPTFHAADLGYGPLHPDAMFSPRVAQQLIGLGLLEAIPAADILALADPEDADGDGISGRPNVVWSAEFDQPMLGRFGHKALVPTIREQSAAALAADMGIATPLFPAPAGDCTVAQADCRAAPHGGDPAGAELAAVGLDLLTFYSRNLGVPARRDPDAADVLRGREVFHQTGCTACHQPGFVTHRLADQPERSFQLIWPYTDLLLHDMGPGLADHRPEGGASGSEWRTAPLWGIGLTATVSGKAGFLHDGRAQSLLEAILWHGGEAEPSRDRVVALPPADRAALIRFVESL